MDSQGFLGMGRGVYNPFFLIVSLEMAQEVQDMIYFSMSYQIFGNKNVFEEQPQFSPCQNFLPPDCSELPKSSFHTHL
jgi:hypothetical protein